MKVLLVSPVLISDSLQPNLGLGYLAAAIGAGHEVRIIDHFTGEVKAHTFRYELERFNPAVVGIQSLYLEIDAAGDLVTVAKHWRPSVVTVVGGPAPTAQPREIFSWFGKDLDYAFVGEAEIGFPRLLSLLAAGRPAEADLAQVPGLARRVKGRVVINPQAHTDVAAVPMPAWHLLDIDAYPPAPHGAFYKERPVAPIITSRGCPYRCGFCAAHLTAGRRLRYRPLAHVLDEIEHLVGRRGVREIHVVDDNFTFDKAYVAAFCDGLGGRGIRVPWACPNGVRLETLDAGLLARMRAAGCYSLGLGVESGSQATLDRMVKGQTLEESRAAARLVHESGIHAVGFFVLGVPGETRAQMEETVAFALELPLRRANFMLFVPFPGTPLCGKARAGRLLPRIRSFAEVSYVPEGMSAGELKAFQRNAFMRFYLRPRQFGALAADIRGPAHLGYVGKRILRWIVPGLERL